MLFAALMFVASATPESRLQIAEHALTGSEFERATRDAEALLAAEVLDKAQSARAQRTAAFAQFYLGDRMVAELHLNEYFKLVPEAQIDAKHYPPDLVEFFNELKNKSGQRAAPETKMLAPAPAAAAKGTPRFSPVSLVPFGIGQLLLGDDTAGGIFLGLDAALFATDLALYFVRIKDRQRGDGYTNVSRAQNLQIAQDVAGGALIVSAIVGVIDAIVWSPGRVAAKRVSVMVTPISQGAMLAATVQF